MYSAANSSPAGAECALCGSTVCVGLACCRVSTKAAGTARCVSGGPPCMKAAVAPKATHRTPQTQRPFVFERSLNMKAVRGVKILAQKRNEHTRAAPFKISYMISVPLNQSGLTVIQRPSSSIHVMYDRSRSSAERGFSAILSRLSSPSSLMVTFLC